MNTILRLGLAVALLAAGAGCIGYERQSSNLLQPSATGADALVGLWASSGGPGAPSAGSCNGFEWRPTHVSGNSASGTFSATCAGGITLTGTAKGTVLGDLVEWVASGTASGPGGISCPFTLQGTARLEGSTITVPYTGTTCVGPVSGTETLTKR